MLKIVPIMLCCTAQIFAYYALTHIMLNIYFLSSHASFKFIGLKILNFKQTSFKFSPGFMNICMKMLCQ